MSVQPTAPARFRTLFGQATGRLGQVPPLSIQRCKLSNTGRNKVCFVDFGAEWNGRQRSSNMRRAWSAAGLGQIGRERSASSSPVSYLSLCARNIFQNRQLFYTFQCSVSLYGSLGQSRDGPFDVRIRHVWTGPGVD